MPCVLVGSKQWLRLGAKKLIKFEGMMPYLGIWAFVVFLESQECAAKNEPRILREHKFLRKNTRTTAKVHEWLGNRGYTVVCVFSFFWFIGFM